TWHVDVSVPDVLVGDHMRLQQVIDSIVDNAIKFTSSGGVCVRLQCLSPDTHTPTHLLSLGCLLAETTPCCPPAAAPTVASATSTATSAVACTGRGEAMLWVLGGVHGVGKERCSGAGVVQAGR
ncbi:unnamed protein product, partial [Closterium sp. NIES-54]